MQAGKSGVDGAVLKHNFSIWQRSVFCCLDFFSYLNEVHSYYQIYFPLLEA